MVLPVTSFLRTHPNRRADNQRIAAGTVIKPSGARAVGKVCNDDRADWREAWALFPGSVAYVWHAGTKAGIVQDSLAACGFETRSQIIWAKNKFAIGRGHYHCKHEPCWYVVRKGSTASWVGDHCQTTLWQIDKNLKSETGHGTQKPVECIARVLGVSKPTLRKHCGTELDTDATRANSKVADFLFYGICGGTGKPAFKTSAPASLPRSSG